MVVSARPGPRLGPMPPKRKDQVLVGFAGMASVPRGWSSSTSVPMAGSIHDYISEFDCVVTANYVLDKLMEVVKSLSKFPERGSYPKELVGLGIKEYRPCTFPAHLAPAHQAQATADFPDHLHPMAAQLDNPAGGLQRRSDVCRAKVDCNTRQPNGFVSQLEFVGRRVRDRKGLQ